MCAYCVFVCAYCVCDKLGKRTRAREKKVELPYEYVKQLYTHTRLNHIFPAGQSDNLCVISTT